MGMLCRAGGSLLVVSTLVACGRLGYDANASQADAGGDAALDGGTAPGDSGNGDGAQVDATGPQADAGEAPLGPVSALSYAWHQEFVGADIAALSADTTGGLVAGDRVDGDLEISGMVLDRPPGTDGYLVRLEQESGDVDWLLPLLGITPLKLCPGADGSTYAAVSSIVDYYWVLYNSAGASTGVGSSAGVLSRAIASNELGHVFIAGSYFYPGTPMLPGSDIVGDGVSTDGKDAFVLALDASHSLLWIHRLGGPGVDPVWHLA